MVLFSLLVVNFVSAADHTPIQTDSVFLPDSITTGSCTDLCDGSSDCDCQQNCACAPGDDCTLQDDSDRVIITFFYSETCPHCHEALAFFDELSQTRDDFIVDKYEVVHNESDRAYAIEFCQEQDVPFKIVPTFFIGDKYFIGYSESMNNDILDAIDVVKYGGQT